MDFENHELDTTNEALINEANQAADIIQETFIVPVYSLFVTTELEKGVRLHDYNFGTSKTFPAVFHTTDEKYLER